MKYSYREAMVKRGFVDPFTVVISVGGEDSLLPGGRREWTGPEARGHIVAIHPEQEKCYAVAFETTGGTVHLSKDDLSDESRFRLIPSSTNELSVDDGDSPILITSSETADDDGAMIVATVDDQASAGTYHYPRAYAIKHAARLALAWNAHEGLVAALSALHAYARAHDAAYRNGFGGTDALYMQVHAALESANPHAGNDVSNDGPAESAAKAAADFKPFNLVLPAFCDGGYGEDDRPAYAKLEITPEVLRSLGSGVDLFPPGSRDPSMLSTFVDESLGIEWVGIDECGLAGVNRVDEGAFSSDGSVFFLCDVGRLYVDGARSFRTESFLFADLVRCASTAGDGKMFPVEGKPGIQWRDGDLIMADSDMKVDQVARGIAQQRALVEQIAGPGVR